MATTESRPGFRLPWTTEREEAGEAAGAGPVDRLADVPTAEPPVAPDARLPDTPPPDDPPAPEASAPETVEAPTPSGPEIADAASPSTVASTAAALGPQRGAADDSEEPTPSTPSPGRRRSNVFLAELARAMHAAAHEARERVLEQFRAESKAFIEELHSRSAEEAAALRRAADEDIAGIREWSKAEIARIREETERRIAERKSALEAAVEAQAARIESQIERLQGAVAGFEAEMDRFFETLLAVEDPTEFAALAAKLPEPPPFEEILAAPPDEAVPETPLETGELDPAAREAAFAAIEAAARAAEVAETPAEGAGEPAAAATDLETEGPPTEGALSPEAEDAAEAATGQDELEGLDDAQIAARLGFLAGHVEEPAPPSQPVRTQVAVVGLVSVASIAGFKRQLAHLPGVHSVGVASGPNGEFLFSVTHDPDLDLAAVVPGLPGFGARITEARPGSLAVTAHDPDLSA